MILHSSLQDFESRICCQNVQLLHEPIDNIDCSVLDREVTAVVHVCTCASRCFHTSLMPCWHSNLRPTCFQDTDVHIFLLLQLLLGPAARYGSPTHFPSTRPNARWSSMQQVYRLISFRRGTRVPGENGWSAVWRQHGPRTEQNVPSVNAPSQS